MKSRVQRVLQRLLGLEAYLLLFAIFRVFVTRYDRRERGLLHFARLLPAGAVVLDIGANIGVTSTIVKQVIPSASVVSFEPMPVNVRTLRRVFRLFRVDAEVQPVAVGDACCEVEMVLPKQDGVVMHGLSHILRRPRMEVRKDSLVWAVPMIKLDSSRQLWADRRVDGIKLDVENAESLVLEGARQLIATDLPIIYCELWDNENRTRCFELLRELEYSVMVLRKGKLTAYKDIQSEADNFFLLPANGRA